MSPERSYPRCRLSTLSWSWPTNQLYFALDTGRWMFGSSRFEIYVTLLSHLKTVKPYRVILSGTPTPGIRNETVRTVIMDCDLNIGGCFPGAMVYDHG